MTKTGRQKTGRRDENIDFLTKFDEIGEIRDLWENLWRNMYFFWRTKNGIFGGKIWLEKALSHKFNHVTF